MSLRFGDVRLLAQDYPAQFRFYRDVLELPLDWGDDQSGYAQFKCGSTVIAIFERAPMAEIIGTAGLPTAPPCQDRFALSFAVTDVDETHRRLLNRGAGKATDPHDQADWGYRVAHIRDADGNLVELYAPLAATAT